MRSVYGGADCLMSNSEKKSLHDKLYEKKKDIAEKAHTAVENGAGNEVISVSQQMLTSVFTAPLVACKTLTRQMLMLTPKMLSKISGRVYLLACILCAIDLLVFIFDSSFKLIMHMVAVVIAAFVFDLLLRKQESSDKTIRPKSPKRTTNSKDESDII